MSDLISRKAAIKTLERKKDKNAKGDISGFYNKIIQNDIDALIQLPSAQPEVIRCKDCRWWDKYDEKHGYCMAAKHGFMSSHWEISIYRTYDEDFFCADAEPKQEGSEDL